MDSNHPILFLGRSFIEKSNIYSGNTELIDSRSFLCYDNNSPIEIEEIFNATFRILIRIILSEDDSKEHKLKVNVDTKSNTIEYTCINFNNQLGTGTSKPIEIGTVEGKKIFIHFWLFAYGDNSMTRKVEYSVWKER